MPRSKVNKQGILAAERRIQALRLRAEGKKYWEIGEALGCSEDTARGILVGEFARLKKEQNGLAEEAFQVNLDRFNSLLAGVWHDALEGDRAAVEVALKVLDRINRMMGLDAPARTEARVTYDSMPTDQLEAEARRLGILPEDPAGGAGPPV